MPMHQKERTTVPNRGGLRQRIVKKELMATAGSVRHYIYPASRRWQTILTPFSRRCFNPSTAHFR
jgi:hypothetical protein